MMINCALCRIFSRIRGTLGIMGLFLRYLVSSFAFFSCLQTPKLISKKTWEDPTHITPLTSLPGDSDPLDVCELAGEVGYAGQIKQVKVLGAFAVLEEEQTDWKVIVVDTANQALAEQLHDISDVEELMPGYIETMLEWFRVYKVPEQGGKRNEIGLGGKVKGREYVFLVSFFVVVFIWVWA